SSERVEGSSGNRGASHHQLESWTVQELDEIAERSNPLINIGDVRIVRLELHADGCIGLIPVAGSAPERLLCPGDHQVYLRARVVALNERKSQQTLAREIAQSPHVRLNTLLAAARA